jgi:hypothetical protein
MHVVFGAATSGHAWAKNLTRRLLSVNTVPSGHVDGSSRLIAPRPPYRGRADSVLGLRVSCEKSDGWSHLVLATEGTTVLFHCKTPSFEIGVGSKDRLRYRRGTGRRDAVIDVVAVWKLWTVGMKKGHTFFQIPG